MGDVKVSIIIPCYNAEKFIQQCVESAIKQDYENKEVIVVDNESSDRSLEIVNDLKKQYDNLIVSSAENIYPNCWDEARSEGHRLASGEYFFTLASDDYIEPSYVTNCMRYMLSNPDKIKAFQSPIRGIGADGNYIGGDVEHKYYSISEFKNICLQRCPVNSPTAVYKRELYDQGKLVTNPEKYGGAADYDLYCKLASEEIFIYPSNKWLGYYYRWHEEQATWNVKREEKNYDGMIQSYWKEKWNL